MAKLRVAAFTVLSLIIVVATGWYLYPASDGPPSTRERWVTLGHWSDESVDPDLEVGYRWFNMELDSFSLPEDTIRWNVSFEWGNGEVGCTAGLYVKKEGESTSIESLFRQGFIRGEAEFSFGGEHLTGVYYVKMNTAKADFNLSVVALVSGGQRDPDVVTGLMKVWHEYGRFTIEPGREIAGDFSFPETSEGVRLTFRVENTTSPPDYLLSARMVRSGETFWEIGPINYGSARMIYEIEGVSGDVTLWVLVVQGRVDLMVEWFG
ncbi:MAG TPA: hypothetical protein VM050_02685 [Patescibacteria group bacterium]|nr:hypothetical protein [Patescibacteria group bacterium]